MFDIFSLLRSKRNILFVSLCWILLWIVPWGKLPTVQDNLYLAFITDMIRLGIAIGIFLVPGLLLYLLLREQNDPVHDWTGIIPIGFSLSVSMIAIVGLAGRVVGLSFSLVKTIFVLIGLIEWVLVLSLKPDTVQFKVYLREAFHNIGRNVPLLFALMIATLMMFNDLLFFIDDTTYLAYMLNWQHASHLGFINIVHRANVVEHVRFWLALYPMGQALLADLSGIAGVLLFGNYLEFWLVPIAVVTSYWFARTLGFSKRAAGFCALIQVSLYVWLLGEFLPVGMWFYQNMAEDKVSVVFILAPVFFTFVLCFLRTPTKNNFILVFLSGLGLTLTHPVMLLYSCIVASGLVLFSRITRRTSWRIVFQLMIVFAMLMLPYAAIRASDIPSQLGVPFNATTAGATFEYERYLNIVNDVFYGVNPGVLQFIDIPPDSNGYTAFQFFRVIPILLALIAGIIAFVKRKDGPLYWYILACVLLISFATIPYTGWILGYFASARLISRVSWFSPLGLGSVLIAKAVVDRCSASAILEKRNLIQRFRGLNGTFLGVLVCFAFASPMLALNIATRASSYFEVLDHNKQLARIGDYIDQNTTDPVTIIALDYTDTQMLPGIAAHTNLISFREATLDNGHNYFLPVKEIERRIYASNLIQSLDPAVSYQERCSYMKEYDLKFVLAPSEDAIPFANAVGKCKLTVETVFKTKDLVLFKLTY